MADAIQSEFQAPKRNSDVMKTFGQRLKSQFSVNESHRRPKELEWLESLRQCKGIYDPEVKIEANASKVYPKLTRSKVNIVLSRLHDMLFPETDRNWEIQPTPEPRIDVKTVTEIAKGLIVANEDGSPKFPTPDDLKIAIRKYCAERSEAMTRAIDDQLTEMDYPEETKKVLRSGLVYGTGVMKGPMVRKREKRVWEPDTTTGMYVESASRDDVPYYEFVRIWDWYPDMSTVDLACIEGCFQRHVMTKHDLRELMKRDDFYADMISGYLRDHPHGDATAKNWEVDLQVIEVEAGSGKGKRPSTTSATTDYLNESANATSRQAGKKYQVLEWWGYVDGSDLEACGVDMTGKDVGLEHAAHVWILGNVPISATLFEGALDRYKVFYYEKDETSIFGEGLARVMRHSQLAISAAARMILDNGACVAGPQLELNWNLLSPGQDLTSFYARKIWWREGRGIDAQYPAVRNIELNSHISELISIADYFKTFADEETTLPTWMIGQMVSNETAQATSGRQSTITISIKDVVKNFDAFTEKAIRDLYAWNMEFNPRPDIKGDYEVRARGVSSLVMKEIRMQALNQLAQTMLPEDWDYFDRRDFLKERMKAHDINIPMKSEEEAAKSREMRENSKAQQLAYAQMEADVAYTKAQTMAQLTKAKEKNVSAVKMASEPPEPPPPGADPRLNDAELLKKQAEIDKIRTETDIKVANLEADMAKMRAEIDRKSRESDAKIAQDTVKTASEVSRKKAESEHGMKVKEKAAMIKAKQKPAAKPKAKAKTGGVK